ncbi:hypothetical protein OHB04_16310 [Streptomyces sp. NBC_01775]|uniref:hypothetical protein n=1 Tax=Streptomyces sp. NBC_01775 TaxID=2975939 RepID=UPI002DDC4DF3|nr:hypothetical protein [Streptomyces sp. NBC_01775]WSB77178.1 hypothetical protein OHB04_16310 [Streptomyces sp. NBC_01775]
MADDRYGWLDEETAERLLRRLPVDAQETGTPDPGRQPGHPASEQPDMPGEPDDQRAGKAPKSTKDRKAGGALDVPSDAWFRDADRRAAAKLASVLDDLAAEHTAPRAAGRGATAVELPGEAAALDAFRAARVGALRGGAVSAGGPASDSASGSASEDAPLPETAPEGVRGVHGGSRHARGGDRPARDGHSGRRARYVLAGRPLRAGFAMALAGCALGGVAVAAGTGVLPTPFGGNGVPAVTMSPAVSPEGDRSANEAAGGAGAEEDTAGGKHRRHNGAGGEERTKDPDGSKDSRDLANSGGSGKKHKHQDADKHGKPGKGGERDKKPGHGRGSDSDKRAIAAALCKAYTDGKLEAQERRKLERAAGGRAVVQKFCVHYSKPGGGEGGEQSGSGGPQVPGTPGGSTGQPGHSGGSGSGGGDGGGDGGSGDPGDSGGTSGGDAGGSGTGGSGAAGGTAGTPSDPAETGAPGAAGGAGGG